MVGRSVALYATEKSPARPKGTVISLDHVTVKDSRGLTAVKDLSLDIHAGEVVGLAGIDGNGQSELISAMTGLMPTASGKIMLNGKNIANKKPRQDRKSTRLNSSHVSISYAVFCLKKKIV